MSFHELFKSLLIGFHSLLIEIEVQVGILRWVVSFPRVILEEELDIWWCQLGNIAEGSKGLPLGLFGYDLAIVYR